MKFLLALLVIFASLQAFSEAAKPGRDAVLMSDIQTLLFRKGKFTDSRRGSPIQQLHRIGGNARKDFMPDVVMCRNEGSDGSAPIWRCESQMPAQFQLGEVRVSCEGYSFPGDQYVLKDSCNLDFEVNVDKTSTHYNSADEKRGFFSRWFGSNSQEAPREYASEPQHNARATASSSFWSTLFWSPFSSIRSLFKWAAILSCVLFLVCGFGLIRSSFSALTRAGGSTLRFFGSPFSGFFSNSEVQEPGAPQSQYTAGAYSPKYPQMPQQPTATASSSGYGLGTLGMASAAAYAMGSRSANQRVEELRQRQAEDLNRRPLSPSAHQSVAYGSSISR